MTKISQYLNEHILGEVICAESVRQKFSTDASILNIMPELVINPRLTNDIRKIARFTWQLAEKGHILPITVRGGGTDRTGAAINSGIIINTLAHLNDIIFINLKDKNQFVHVQPGITFGSINNALKSHGIYIPTYPSSYNFSTIGGAVANNASGMMAGQYNRTGEFVTRLEVVLANGDVIETGRISRHDLNKKKGLQTLEGEIYRKIDGIIEDNEQLIKDKISKKPNENSGYSGIAKVKERDGSFDLTPLFIGSQGTLGIISEIVIKTMFYSNEESIIVATFDNPEAARDCTDSLAKLKPANLEVIDYGLFKIAKTHGKKFIFDKSNENSDTKTVVYMSFNDFSSKMRRHKMAKALKIISKTSALTYTSNDFTNEELHAIREVSPTVILTDTKDESYPSLIDGASIPAERREEYIVAVAELASKHHIDLPLQINWLNGVVHTRTAMNLHAIADKQRAFKLLSDYMELVAKFGGDMTYESSEGRLKSTAVFTQIDSEIAKIYDQIRLAFDPFGTLNPGVKQPSDLKTLVAQLNPSYNISDFAKNNPVN